MSPILVFHGIGAVDGGTPWRDALEAAGWDGPVLAPDLPGHGTAPPPLGGHHELADPAFAAPAILAAAGLGDQRPVVVGVGANGWSAQMLALGGRASALVLIDGLGGPWLSPTEAVHSERQRLRALADDPAALAPHTAPGLDPRLAHGPHPYGSRDLAFRVAHACALPTLLIESSASPTPPDDRAELVAAWAAPAQLHQIDEPTPAACTSLIAAWHRSI